MNKVTDSLINMPDSAMQNITVKPDAQPGPSAAPSQASDFGPKTLTMEQAVAGAEGAKVTSILGSAGASGSAPNAGATPGGTTAPLGALMSAEVVLNLVDMFLPALMVIALKRLNLTLKKESLQLTAKEKDTIAPVLEKALATINFQFENPWTALALTVTVVYGSKIGEKGLTAWMDKKAADEAVVASDEVQQAQAVSEQTSAYPEELIVAWQKKRKVGRNKAIMILNERRISGKPLNP